MVRRESGVKGEGRSSGECVRVEEGRGIGRVKGNRVTKGWGSIRNDNWAKSMEI